jgi:hypothetical protein
MVNSSGDEDDAQRQRPETEETAQRLGTEGEGQRQPQKGGSGWRSQVVIWSDNGHRRVAAAKAQQ